MVGTAPEVFYNSSHPEVHNIEESTKEPAPSAHIRETAFEWYLLVAVLVVAVAIAIGVGVGIWRHHQHAPHSSSTAIRCGCRTDMDCSWLTVGCIACRPPAQRYHQKLSPRPNLRPLVLHPPVLHNTYSMIHL